MTLWAIFEGNKISDATAFTTLLTVESLLFTGMSVALTLSNPQAQQRQIAVKPSTVGVWIASLISAVALCAVLMWTSVFAEPWPCDARGAIVALVVLLTILGQATFGWYVAFALRRRGTLPPRTEAPAR